MVFLRQEYLFQGDEDVKQINKNGAPQWFEQWKTDFVEANSRQPHYKVDFAVNDSDGIERRRKLRLSVSPAAFFEGCSINEVENVSTFF